MKTIKFSHTCNNQSCDRECEHRCNHEPNRFCLEGNCDVAQKQVHCHTEEIVRPEYICAYANVTGECKHCVHSRPHQKQHGYADGRTCANHKWCTALRARVICRPIQDHMEALGDQEQLRT